MAVIDEIRRRIADSGLKAPTIEKMVGHVIGREAIGKIISGKTENPRIESVEALAGVLGLTVSLSIGEVEPPAEMPRASPEDEIRDAIERMPGITSQDADDTMELLVVCLDQKRGQKGSGKKRQLG